MFTEIAMWWYCKTTFEKVLFVIKIVLWIAIIVSGILMIQGVWEGNRTISYFGAASLFAIRTYEQWDEKRGWAIYHLCMAGLFAHGFVSDLHDYIVIRFIWPLLP